MSNAVSPLFNGVSVIDANGNPVSGGKIYTYVAGTATPQATYQDSTTGTPNTNPIILDTRGQAPAPIWLLPDPALYKFVLTDANDVPLGPAFDYIVGFWSLPVTAFPAVANSSMGGFRLTTLGNAAADTDALNRITADGRYFRIPVTTGLDMNGNKVTELGVATLSTDAMSRAACDARYPLLSGAYVQGALGFDSGQRGSVTQLTSKATAITLDAMCGSITTHNAALAAGATVSFTWNNALLAANDVIIFNVAMASGASYTVTSDPAAGSTSVRIRNNSAGSLSEALDIRFAIIKA